MPEKATRPPSAIKDIQGDRLTLGCEAVEPWIPVPAQRLRPLVKGHGVSSGPAEVVIADDFFPVQIQRHEGITAFRGDGGKDQPILPRTERAARCRSEHHGLRPGVIGEPRATAILCKPRRTTRAVHREFVDQPQPIAGQAACEIAAGRDELAHHRAVRLRLAFIVTIPTQEIPAGCQARGSD